MFLGECRHLSTSTQPATTETVVKRQADACTQPDAENQLEQITQKILALSETLRAQLRTQSLADLDALCEALYTLDAAAEVHRLSIRCACLMEIRCPHNKGLHLQVSLSSHWTALIAAYGMALDAMMDRSPKGPSAETEAAWAAHCMRYLHAQASQMQWERLQYKEIPEAAWQKMGLVALVAERYGLS